MSAWEDMVVYKLKLFPELTYLRLWNIFHNEIFQEKECLCLLNNL